jgi:excinuclease UvrABC nuclease subunit
MISVEFSREQLDLYRKPCVYTLLASDGRVMYVGYGTKGFSRVFADATIQPDRMLAFKTCKSLSVIFFDSEERAKKVEADWIHSCHPSHNRSCSKCSFYPFERSQFPVKGSRKGNK